MRRNKPLSKNEKSFSYKRYYLNSSIKNIKRGCFRSVTIHNSVNPNTRNFILIPRVKNQPPLLDTKERIIQRRKKAMQWMDKSQQDFPFRRALSREIQLGIIKKDEAKNSIENHRDNSSTLTQTRNDKDKIQKKKFRRKVKEQFNSIDFDKIGEQLNEWTESKRRYLKTALFQTMVKEWELLRKTD
mmetsp:Transcript_25749/g.22849  ORF Transcript_25749/g.22849 Transcript_25749/m.22849 type:complete len:186 (+) Transcript_25749:106-663(+)